MHKLQQIQSIGNLCLCIIGFSSFIILANQFYLICLSPQLKKNIKSIRLTKSSCSNEFYSCTAYRSFQTNAAFSFFLIFAPWIGMIGALKGKKILVFIYLAILGIILLTYMITCIIIFSNSDVRNQWKIARDTDSLDILATAEAFMASFNMLIAQIILVWIFLVGTAIITFGAVKKQDEEGISEPLQ